MGAKKQTTFAKEMAERCYTELQGKDPKSFFKKTSQQELALLIKLSKAVNKDEFIKMTMAGNYDHAIKLSPKEMEMIKGGADPAYDLGHAMGGWVRDRLSIAWNFYF